MGYLIEGYKIMGKETMGYIHDHRSGIGTIVSIGGTIVSNILSTKAGAKSARQIDAKEAELGRPLKTSEKVKLCWANHIASTATAGLACAGAGYSHNQHVKDFNKVAMAYSGIKKLYDSTQKATKEVLGEKKNAELQDKLNQKYLEEHPEVKKQIIDNNYNPDPSTRRKFWEPVSGISFYSTVDRIELAIKTMKAEMQAKKPRVGNSSVVNEDKCIKLSRFFDLLDVQIPQAIALSDTMQYMAFLKGHEENGSDDDEIGVYYTPMMLDDDTMDTCAALNWETRPSDLRYGGYVKL